MTKPDWVPTSTSPYVALIGEVVESDDPAASLRVQLASDLFYVPETGIEAFLRFLRLAVDLSWLIEHLPEIGVPEPQKFLEEVIRLRRIVLLGRSQEEDLESLRGIGVQFEDDLISLTNEFMAADTDEVAELIMNWQVDLDVPSMTAKFAKDRGLSERVLRRQFFEFLSDLLLLEYASFKLVEGWENFVNP